MQCCLCKYYYNSVCWYCLTRFLYDLFLLLLDNFMRVWIHLEVANISVTISILKLFIRFYFLSHNLRYNFYLYWKIIAYSSLLSWYMCTSLFISIYFCSFVHSIISYYANQFMKQTLWFILAVFHCFIMINTICVMLHVCFNCPETEHFVHIRTPHLSNTLTELFFRILDNEVSFNYVIYITLYFHYCYFIKLSIKKI